MNKVVMKVNIYHLIVAVLLIFNFLLRISYLEYPLIHTSRWGDGTRDYLAAHYIVQYGERPLIGPYNLLHGVGISNSPLYYYLLASFLSIYDNILFLGIVNIFFQVATIFLVFFIAKLIFGNLVAIFASTLFSLIPEVLRQSQFIWQPNLMQPFAYLALLLLVLSYIKQNYPSLLLSWLTLIVAITIHNSAFAWFGQFLLFTLVILKHWKKKLIYYLGLIVTVVSSLSLLYLPVIISNLKFPHKISNNQAVIGGVNNYFSNLFYNIDQVFSSLSLNPILLAFLILSFFWYLVNHSPKSRILILISFSFFLTPIIFSSFFNKNQIHYLILCFGVAAIIISELAISLIAKTKRVLFGSLNTLIIIILVITVSGNLAFLKKDVIQQKNLYFEDDQLLAQAISAIQSHIYNIKTNQDFSNFNFFQIVSFATSPNTFRYPPLDTIFLVPLEKNLRTKLGKISDEDIYTIVQTNQAKFIFVVCFEFYQKFSVKDCTKDFLNLNQNFTVVQNIYLRYPLSIFLAQKNDI